MEFSCDSNTKFTEKPWSLFQLALFLMFPVFQKCLNPHVRTNKLKAVLFTTFVFLKISLKDTSFHISLNSLGFFRFSPECLLNFLWVLYFTMCEKHFLIYVVHILGKCVESMHFYSCPSPSLKTPGRIFWKFVSL